MRTIPTTDAHFLSDRDRATADALLEALLPGSDTSPGARDAGAGEFLDRLLANDPDRFYEIKGWRTLYGAGLPALDAAATARFGRPAGELSVADATALLHDLQRGALEGMPAEIDQRRLFTTLRAHCVDGCFSDPRWGGNRDAVVWRWVGYNSQPEDFVRAADGSLTEVSQA